MILLTAVTRRTRAKVRLSAAVSSSVELTLDRIRSLTKTRPAANDVDICVMECMLCAKVILFQIWDLCFLKV